MSTSPAPTWRLVILVVAAVLVAGLVLLANGCRTTPPALPAAPPPAIAPSVGPCLVHPPPDPESWNVTDGAPSGLVCLTDPDARTIIAEIRARRAWEADAWARCAALDDAPDAGTLDGGRAR